MTRKPIYLKTVEGECELRGSRFFGSPAMPADIPWPTYDLDLDAELNPDLDAELWQEPLDFICQIEYKQGLLLFFANIAYYAGWDAEPAIFCHVGGNDVARVIYIPQEELPNVVEREDVEPLAPALPIELSEERPPIGEDEHQLFGEPEHREWEDWDSPYEGWQLLLQVDSTEGPDYQINFVDCGVLNFIIDPDDLACDRFDNVRAIILSA